VNTQSSVDDRDVQLDNLIDGAEELLTQLAHERNPEVERLRDRVDQAIGDARRAIAKRHRGSSGARGRVRFGDLARSADDYIRGYPWLAVATGVLAAGAVAYITGAAIGPKSRASRGS
jgi:ElaB/YqjD/DUF883 family membrane-anchored ribosome-binding protein